MAPFLESFTRATTGAPTLLFMGTVRDDDELRELDRCGCDHIDITWAPGDFARKVNTAIAVTDHPYIFVTGDDVAFHDGWLDAAVAAATATGAGVIGTQDLHNRRVIDGLHATHWLITRDYATVGTIDDPTRTLHEGYHHNFVDDELIGTAKARGAWTFAPDAVVEHLHPNYDGAPRDATYNMARRHFAYDRALYALREPMWTSQ